MGQKASVVQGVRSENYFEPGNAINEIWLGDVEIVSRLPFGDSDMAQAGWPEGDWPKIPWHPFIIPLRRKLATRGEPDAPTLALCDGQLCACRLWGGPFTNLSSNSLMAIWLCFFFILLCCCLVPNLLRRVRHYCSRQSVDIGKRQSTIKTWLCVGFATLVVSATLTVFGSFALPAMFLCQKFPQDTRVWVNTDLYFYPYMFIMHCAWGVAVVLGTWCVGFELCRLAKTYEEGRNPVPTDDLSIPTTARSSTGCSDPHEQPARHSGEAQAASHPPRQGVSLDSQRPATRTSHEPRHSTTAQDLKSVFDPGADAGGDPRPSLQSQSQRDQSRRDRSRRTTSKSLKSQLDAEDIQLDALTKWMSS